MYQKLNNDAWEEYISKYDKIKEKVTIKSFCIENNLNKGQFYYHKKRLEKEENRSNEPIFHAIHLKESSPIIQENKDTLKEVKINIGNANITVPASETTLISSIIKELVTQC